VTPRHECWRCRAVRALCRWLLRVACPRRVEFHGARPVADLERIAIRRRLWRRLAQQLGGAADELGSTL